MIWEPRVFATDFTSTNFILRDPITDGSGGGYSTSDNFRSWGSLGQPAPGRSTSDSNELRAGFLYFPDDSTSPPSSGGGDGGGGSGGGGGGIGTSSPPTPPDGAPPLLPGGIIPPLISLLTGEPISAICKQPGILRSDLNCDGHVDLQDLSILLTRPTFVTGRILSFLFSDWTARLPIPFGATPSVIAQKGGAQIVQPPPVTAEASNIIKQSSEPGFFSRVKNIVSGVARAVVAGIKSFTFGFLKLIGF